MFIQLKAICPAGEVLIELDADEFYVKKLLLQSKRVHGRVVSCSIENPSKCTSWLKEGCLLYQWFTGNKFVSGGMGY